MSITLTLLLISLIFNISEVNADLVSTYFDYETNSSLTEDNLDGNLNNIRTVINGNINNANIKSGYSLYEVLGVLPSAGTVGRTVFYTIDKTLNFDTGSEWYSAITLLRPPVQGDIVYYNGTNWVALSVGTSGQHLITQGAGANPAWSNAIDANSGTIDGVTTTFGSGQLLASADLDIGTYEFRANTFESDVATGTAPLTVASTTQVLNLNAEYIGGKAATYLSFCQLFTSNGTFTAPAGVTKVYITMVGGGGGGGGGKGDPEQGSGGGGGGGESIIKYPYTVVPTNEYAVVVGAAGAAGAAAGSGGVGGDSSFDTSLVASGGGAGTYTGNAGIGGTGGGGGNDAALTVAGGNGIKGGNGANGIDAGNGGGGGGSCFGTGGAGSTSGSGANATGWGAGGGGAHNDTTATGGAGTVGFVLVEW